MDSLISLIIDLITALMGRSKKEEDAPPPAVNRPDPSRPRPQTRPTSWEDELRRLLEGQTPAAPPVQRPAPVSAPPMPQVRRPVQPSPVPRIVTVPTVDRPPVRSSAPVYSGPRPVPVLIPPDPLEVSAGKLAPLSESQQAYARASQIDKTAAAQIERVPGHHVEMTRVVRRSVSPEVTQVISLFKNARSARQAVLISAVFGPPRAFEEQTSTNF